MCIRDRPKEKSKSAFDREEATEEQSITKSQRLEDINWGADDLDLTEEINKEESKSIGAAKENQKSKKTPAQEIKAIHSERVEKEIDWGDSNFELDKESEPKNKINAEVFQKVADENKDTAILNIKKEASTANKATEPVIATQVVQDTKNAKQSKDKNDSKIHTEVSEEVEKGDKAEKPKVQGDAKSAWEIDWGEDEFLLNENAAKQVQKPAAKLTSVKETVKEHKAREIKPNPFNRSANPKEEKKVVQPSVEQPKAPAKVKEQPKANPINDIDWGTDDLDLGDMAWGSTVKAPAKKPEVKAQAKPKTESKPKEGKGLDAINWDDDDFALTESKPKPLTATKQKTQAQGNIHWGTEDFTLNEQKSAGKLPAQGVKSKQQYGSAMIKPIDMKKEVAGASYIHQPPAKQEAPAKKIVTPIRNPFGKKEAKQKQMPSFNVVSDNLF
eukprot:TRINITY_DN12527_c0_g2_i2.p1 TRINITY_DN12527_c0_g2~~TRINITY_DN12527_c0_g2_i2.p1  ORF type:complete len:443 (-),score=109.06 TRINITY_DN12527_c0_g2_i2:124-1452(-)